jgi:hypothetical protein
MDKLSFLVCGARRASKGKSTMSAITYHIVWTTYGTWLRGDVRGRVDKKNTGIQVPDPERERQSREWMAEDAVLLTPCQRVIADSTIRDHCPMRFKYVMEGQ